MKLRSELPAAAAAIAEGSLRLYDFRIPAFMTQRAPVPAHAMHFKKPRRSTPSRLWLWRISSWFFRGINPSLPVLLENCDSHSIAFPCITAEPAIYSRDKLNRVENPFARFRHWHGEFGAED